MRNLLKSLREVDGYILVNYVCGICKFGGVRWVWIERGKKEEESVGGIDSID